MKSLFVLLIAGVALAFSQAVDAADDHRPQSIVRENVIKVEPQPWQMRRAKFRDTIETLLASNGENPEALRYLDEALTKFEMAPVSLTPMEAMDIWGLFYVPREGDLYPELTLRIIAIYAILGWYDALRFADASGRAEISFNESFFSRAFRLAGPEIQKFFTDFLTNHPEKASEAVQIGISTAREWRNQVEYDVRWPNAYGLTRMRCALEGEKECPPPSALPREQWDAAFEEAVALVERYYRDNSKK